MAQNHSADISGKPVEKVGAILVHGIGEQRRFEHLEGETRKIVDAIIVRYGARRRDVTPTLTTGSSDAFLGDQANWASGGKAPLHILVKLPDRIVDIAFHEVWWEDINEKLTIGKQIKFWAWGLSLAGIATHNAPFLPGASHTRPPRNAGALTFRNRIRMGYISALFGLSAFSVALINLIFKQFGFPALPLTATIVNYLSAVKLYSQEKRAGGGTMDGPDEPPRAAIRRRMIRAMIEVAEASYERWYIIAHSLGTVVAWNGLMEIQQTLPNYIDQSCWNAPETLPLRATSPTAFGRNAMLPNRPVWVGHRDIIDRDALFKTFRGVLTYGSPLERFCALWSAMVPINRVEDPFQAGSEWVNVYDPTDPVGTWLDDFDPEALPPARAGHTKLKPYNFPCRASPILLFSHLCYLTASPLSALRLVNDREHTLVNQVADWLVEGGSLAKRVGAAPQGLWKFWMHRAGTLAETSPLVRCRVIWRLVQAGLVGLVLTILTLLSLKHVIVPALKLVAGYLPGRIAGLAGDVARWWSDIAAGLAALSKYLTEHFWLPTWLADFVSKAALLWLVTAAVVIGASIIHYILSTREREASRRDAEKQRGMGEE
jgi:hypothetical protein